MSQSITEQLFVDDGSSRVRLVGEPPFERTIDSGKTFEFQLDCKQTQMGELSINQFWMNTSGLYGDQKDRPKNHDSIIGYYWARCCEHFTIVHEGVQESFLLVHLLPYARRIGSRRVFADGGQSRSRTAGLDKRSLANELDDLLRGSLGTELSEIEFRDRTGELLGPTVYPQEIWEDYHRSIEDVLFKGRQALEAEGEDKGIQETLAAWNKKMKSIGRHRGNESEKLILDILSYEARAAFNRCYSAVWLDLVPHLANKYVLSDEAVLFHKLWHLDIQQEAEKNDQANFHLFHGSVFALHPACGNFMMSQRGPELVGEWLRDPHSVEKYQRLLHAIYVAFIQYNNCRQDYAESRKKESQGLHVDDWISFEQGLVDKHTGRKPGGPRETHTQ